MLKRLPAQIAQSRLSGSLLLFDYLLYLCIIFCIARMFDTFKGAILTVFLQFARLLWQLRVLSLRQSLYIWAQ